MPINNVKSFTVVGRGDVFLLDPNGSYTITTIGALGGASDVHVWEGKPDNDLASIDDTALGTNWALLRDTGLSGEAAALGVTARAKKLFVDVIDGAEGVVITVAQTGALSGDGDKSAGLLSANNQRQKFSSAVRRLN